MAAQQESVKPVSPGLTTLGQLREWLTLIGAVVVVLGGLLGGVRLVVAPLHTEMQAMRRDIQAVHGRMDRMEVEIRSGREETTALRQDMHDEFRTVHEDIADIRERLTRIESLLESDTDQPGGAVPRE